MLELALGFCKLGAQCFDHGALFGTRAPELEQPRRERARGALLAAARQVLINPCGFRTNFLATPLSKSL
jgi:hypothetical protein